MTGTIIASWFCRIVAAGILLQTLVFKFTGAEESVHIFRTLGVEPWGRYLTGVVELVTGICLLVPATAWLGALLALGLMAGAIAVPVYPPNPSRLYKTLPLLEAIAADWMENGQKTPISCRPDPKAPGEFILVNDGQGGTVRMSGTSFATPLVSGAAALVKGRWNWLEGGDIADVLLRSARDLGAPGTDAVYGRGMLDVYAALAPLGDESDLYFVDEKERTRSVKKLGFFGGNVNFHASGDNTVTIFEEINDTYRDFTVSMDDIVLHPGQGGNGGKYGQYNAERASKGNGGRNFAEAGFNTRIVARQGDVTYSAFAAPADPFRRASRDALHFQTGMEIVNDDTGHALRFGYGEGALALNAQEGFQLFSDHRPQTGGVNPVLGFASGGGYALSKLRLNETTALSFGASSDQRRYDFVNPITGEERALFDTLSVYEAIAFFTDVKHDLSANVSAHITYTYLREEDGFLGAQGMGAFALDGEVSTDSVTLGSEARLGRGVLLSGSATAARTRATGFDSGILSIQDEPLSTAWQVALRKNGVIGKSDAVRVSLLQPLFQEAGSLRYAGFGVADRETGALGLETSEWALGGERPLMAEALYALDMLEGRAGLSLFARTELSGMDFIETEPSLASGLRVELEF